MSNCPKCGNLIVDGALFCGSCGSKIEESKLPPIQQGFPQQQQGFQQQPIQQGFPQQQQGFQQQPILQGYPQQQQGFQQQPTQQGYSQQQQGFQQQPIQQGYPQQQQGFQQQPIQQGYPQQQPMSSTYSAVTPGTPFIRFIWPKAPTYILLFTYVPWLNKLNVAINGLTVTPFKGIKFKDGFSVDVPINSQYNRIECWLTTPIIKNKTNFYNRIIEFNVDPSQSYIIEIGNPFLFYLLGFKNLIKYNLKDINGNLLKEDNK